MVGDKTLENNEGYLAINCAAATQNILLAAHAEKLGAVWLGVYPKQERMFSISGLFLLPPDIIPFSLIAIGYPNEEKPFPHRFFPDKIRSVEFSSKKYAGDNREKRKKTSMPTLSINNIPVSIDHFINQTQSTVPKQSEFGHYQQLINVEKTIPLAIIRLPIQN